MRKSIGKDLSRVAMPVVLNEPLGLLQKLCEEMEYSDLLEEAGVDTVVELATRKPENLHAKILEVNAAKKLVRRPPSAKMVADWVMQAKELPRVVTY